MAAKPVTFDISSPFTVWNGGGSRTVPSLDADLLFLIFEVFLPESGGF